MQDNGQTAVEQPTPSPDTPVMEGGQASGGGSAAQHDAAPGGLSQLQAATDDMARAVAEVSGDVGKADAATTEATSAAGGPSVAALQWLDFFKPEGIPYAVVVLLLMAFAARFITRQAVRIGERFADRRLVVQQTASFIRFVVYFAGLTFAFLTLFDINQQLLLAIGGTLAVAAGFAMKDLVASIIAGVIILLDRPFQVGDRVTFTGYYGEITHIGLRSVRMMTLDDTQVTIPNNMFLTEAVASGNAGSVDMMIQVDLYIGADEDLNEARRLLSEVVTTSRYVNLNRAWNVSISQVIQNDYFATRLRAKAYVLDARLEKAFEGDITERALGAFAAAGVRPPAVLHRNVGATAPQA